MSSKLAKTLFSFSSRLVLKCLPLLIFFLGSVVLAGNGEKVIKNLHDSKVIKSEDKPHDILNEACYACHPKEKFKFWLLIYGDKEPKFTLEKEPVIPIPAGKKETAGIEERKNFSSHEELGCKFCHYENPTSKEPRFIVEVEDLCKICHPATQIHYIPADQAKATQVKRYIGEGKLPGKEGELVCLSCHKIHDSQFSMRRDYTKVLAGMGVVNPHGSKLYCYVCHPERIKTGDVVKFVTGSNLDKLCLDCHAKPEVPDSPHVWGVYSSEKTWKMDYLGYPLKRGKLTCQSCHDEVCYSTIDEENRMFLRGGPYRNIDDFCYKCHMDTEVAFFSPHRQIDNFGRIIDESCLFCHKGVPRNHIDSNNFELSEDEISICTACHEITPHPGVNHLIKLPSTMKKRKISYEKKHQVILPVGEDGFIKCSTCHNPHSKGVIKGEAGVGAGSKWRVADFKELCAPCHGRY